MTRAFDTPASRTALLVALCATALTGCNKADTNQQQGAPVSGAPIAALPLATATPPPTTLAPAVAALPAPARPVRYAGVGGTRRYRYIDQAYAMNSALGETPPDYTVDYDGTRPWIWRSDNGAYRVVEQGPDGDRYYYYQPGADEPYYIADPDYGYAYEDGALVGVYGPNGDPVADAVARERLYDASRYYVRGNGLYRAAQTQQRQAAYAQNWAARRDAVLERQQQWRQAQQQDADWRAWHDENAVREQQQWQAESQHRLAYAAAIGLGGAAIAAVALHGTHEKGREPPANVDQARRQQMASDQQSHAPDQHRVESGQPQPRPVQAPAVQRQQQPGSEQPRRPEAERAEAAQRRPAEPSFAAQRSQEAAERRSAPPIPVAPRQQPDHAVVELRRQEERPPIGQPRPVHQAAVAEHPPVQVAAPEQQHHAAAPAARPSAHAEPARPVRTAPPAGNHSEHHEHPI